MSDDKMNARRAPRRWWLLAIPLVVLLGASAVKAAGRWGHHGGDGIMGEMMAARIHHALDAVGATDAQKAQVTATWQALRPQLQALHGDGAKLREQLQQALTGPSVDSAQVERLRKDALALADRGSALISQGLVSTAQTLTPDQRQKLAGMLAEHHRHD